MNRRKLFFIALAVALPLVLALALRSARSWQPRATALPPASPGQIYAFAQGDRTDFFWRESGLLLCNRIPVGAGFPRGLTNWNGVSVPLRALSAGRCDLDARGLLAARLRPVGFEGEAQLWDVARARETSASPTLRALPDHAAFGQKALAIAPDGSRVAGSLSYPRFRFPNAIRISDARSGQTLAQFTIPARDEKGRGNSVEIWALAWSPDSRQLAVVGYSRVWIVDGQNARLLRAWDKTGAATTRAAWSPDGQTLALGNGHGTILFMDNAGGSNTRVYLSVHDARTGKVSFSWSQRAASRAVAQGLTNFDFSPDGARLAWGTWDGAVQVADLSSRTVETPFEMPAPPSPPFTGTRRLLFNSDRPFYVAYAPDGRTLAIAAPDRIALWRVR